LGFLIGATAGSEPPVAVQSFGRLAFISLMLVSSLFIFRLLRSGGSIMQSLANGQGGLLLQLHFLWFPVLLITPVIFAFTSALGYHYTAVHLELRMELTFWFFFGLFLLKELLLRSLYIADRRLRYEDALRRRDELRAKRAHGEEVKTDETDQTSLEITEIDFAELSEQNERLIRAGFLFAAVIGIWSIWSDLLPALGFLNSTELPLHASRVVDGISKEVPVTLADLILGLIMVVITVLAAKNIPGVLEIALLQRLPLDPGARYAITSLTQYLIAGIGVFIAFSTLGLQWSNIQWLVAALSVGLGFGLQEIVANFISGIILLFERPIRVGDVVTIDNTTGKVSRIRIRATTIINWDKQELLIPNKEFITGRVINWTLTDKINRVVITVGVAYGTDVERAMHLMLEAADENENVLVDPEPVVTFEGFGDNALTLVLRSYLGSMDNRLETITALHRAINAKFTAAGINIAFPQRDIHLSADKPLDVRLHRDASATE
jgi:potassium efflux system protein